MASLRAMGCECGRSEAQVLQNCSMYIRSAVRSTSYLSSDPAADGLCVRGSAEESRRREKVCPIPEVGRPAQLAAQAGPRGLHRPSPREHERRLSIVPWCGRWHDHDGAATAASCRWSENGLIFCGVPAAGATGTLARSDTQARSPSQTDQTPASGRLNLAVSPDHTTGIVCCLLHFPNIRHTTVRYPCTNRKG